MNLQSPEQTLKALKAELELNEIRRKKNNHRDEWLQASEVTIRWIIQMIENDEIPNAIQTYLRVATKEDETQ